MNEENLSFIDELELLIKARYPIIWVESGEEIRVIEMIQKIANSRNRKLFLWSLSHKSIEINQEDITYFKTPNDVEDIIDFLGVISNSGDAGTTRISGKDYKGSIIILRDLHLVLQSPHVVRKLRDLSASLKNKAITIIITSPIISIPIELQKSITVISLPLPNETELEDVVSSGLALAEGGAPDKFKETVKKTIQELKDSVDYKKSVIDAIKGLTLEESENVIAKSLIKTGGLDIKVLMNEKEQIIKKSQILEYYQNEKDLNDIGGLDNLKEWIKKRKLAFTENAKTFRLRPPRGILLTGIPGTGKSISAKASAKYFQLPLLRLDVSKIFARYVGESEHNIALALKIADAVSPCILWIDEVEKALSGLSCSDQLDSGVTSRIFGQFLTWMQEHTTPVFVIATCNNFLTLPPEFMRRFDNVFFLDVPTEIERKEIFKIHLKKIDRDPNSFNIMQHVMDTEGFSGSEIENIIMSALYDAFFDREELKDNTDINDDYLQKAIKGFVPLSIKRKEELTKIREWGIANATNASRIPTIVVKKYQ